MEPLFILISRLMTFWLTLTPLAQWIRKIIATSQKLCQVRPVKTQFCIKLPLVKNISTRQDFGRILKHSKFHNHFRVTLQIPLASGAILAAATILSEFRQEPASKLLTLNLWQNRQWLRAHHKHSTTTMDLKQKFMMSSLT